jgi:hypothetical protein
LLTILNVTDLKEAYASAIVGIVFDSLCMLISLIAAIYFLSQPAPPPLGFLRRINRLRRQFGLAIWRELPSVEEWLHQSPFE